MLALLKLNLLRAPFEEILETRLDIHGQHEVVQPLSLVNLMTIFVVSKENNIDVWKKAMVCFRAIYMQGQEAKKHEQHKNILAKNDIVVMASILAEVGNSDATVWDLLQKDMAFLIEMEKNTYTKV